MRLLASSLILVLVLGGCQSTATRDSSHSTPAAVVARPGWFAQPAGPDGQLGGVGIARTHLKGPSFQRQTAIARALDEIARQLGVEVASVLEDRTQASERGGLQSSTAIYSVQTTRGEVVRARLREIWVHPQTNEVYAWMTVE
jgi:hypothetical protein